VTLARGLVLAAVVVLDQARLEHDRWWRSPRVVALLRLAPEQSMAVEQLYEEGLPARNHAAENVIYLEEELKYSKQWNGSDDELRRLTEELARARVAECELRLQMLERIIEPLAPPQREQLAGLVRQNRVMESTCSTIGDRRELISVQAGSMR
jgi:hypothetical protein